MKQFILSLLCSIPLLSSSLFGQESELFSTKYTADQLASRKNCIGQEPQQKFH